MLERIEAKIVASFVARRYERLMHRFGGIQKCTWCRQIAQHEQGWGFRAYEPDPGLDVLTCGVCGGTSLWLWGHGMHFIRPLDPPKPAFTASDVTPAPQANVTPSDGLIAAAEAGWNACRRQVYLLSEDYTERTHPLKNGETVEGNFYRGQYDVARSFARAFNSFEARDCGYFQQIDFASLGAAEGQP